MDRWEGRVAVVTGASVGIGAAICESLAKDGMIVIGAARRLEKMKELQNKLSGAKGKFIPFQCDVSKDTEVNALFDFVENNYQRIDVMINNAAKIFDSTLLDGTAQEWRELTDLNVIAYAVCGQKAVKMMQKHDINDGHIININSVVGHEVLPFAKGHFYAATKFAVTALTIGLRQELKQLKSSIRVTSISPGHVDTDFASPITADKKLEEYFSQTESLTAENIAAAVINVVSAPKGVEFIEVTIRPTVEVQM